MTADEAFMLSVGIFGIIVWIWAELTDETSQWRR